jgi:hypothetical protein
MAGLQEIIYRLEEGKWAKAINVFPIILAFFALAVIYDLRAYKGLSSEEAMDVAQLSRNISEGKGYTTYVVRPLSIMLVATARPDHALRLKGDHPDLMHPPVYPLALAGLMKAVPFHFSLKGRTFFMVYQPELIITIFNQLLFFCSVLLLFFIARRLMGAGVAWVTTSIFAASEILWRFSISGVSTMLVIFLFLCLVYLLIHIDELGVQTEISVSKLFIFSGGAGIIFGLGVLTRYSFLAFCVPTLFYLMCFSRVSRFRSAGIFVLAAALTLAPWVWRNYRVSHSVFGLAKYSFYQETPQFKDGKLMRALNPGAMVANSGQKWPGIVDVGRKTLTNLKSSVENDLPRFAGGWAFAFFVAGLLLSYKNQTLSRLRWFLIVSLLSLIVTQSAIRTEISIDSPEINSENLLVLASPLVFLFGTAFFFILLDQMAFAIKELRYAVMAIFVLVLSLPLLLTFTPPKVSPISYPPYYPPVIQEASEWLAPTDLMMSDVPAGVAWYAGKQCIPLTLNSREEYFRFNDEVKTIRAAYFTQRSMDQLLLTQMIKDRDGWGLFLSNLWRKGALPTGFPLRHSLYNLLPNQLYLAEVGHPRTRLK